MDLPGPNFAGYDSSAVTNVSSFDSVNLAIAHGSGDDNGTSSSFLPTHSNEDENADAGGADEFGVVHFANTAHLIDMFTKAHIRKYRFRMFTDRYASPSPLSSTLTISTISLRYILTLMYSDHSISTRGAYRELHEWLTAFLVEKWGKGGSKRQW